MYQAKFQPASGSITPGREFVPQMLETIKPNLTRITGPLVNTHFPVDQPAPVFLLGFMRTAPR